MYSPTPHSLRADVQNSRSTLSEKVSPLTHDVHTTSRMAEPVKNTPVPAGQVAHGTHSPMPALALKCSAAHGLHTRSEDALGGTAS